jgi:DNA-binding MarR family transcriptional regulator
MPRKPLDQLDAGRTYYAEHLPEVGVEHFGALWHLFTVGHLVTTDLNSIARRYDCSFADFDLLGTLAIEKRKSVRATDLASTLYVSNAVVSTRVARLEQAGLLERRPNDEDRRAFDLVLTDKGRRLIEEAIAEIARDAKIVRFFRELSPEDQAALVRILGLLHQRFDREFIGGPYTDD